MLSLKLVSVSLLFLFLTGCNTLQYAKKDQLMLVVPDELLIPPIELNEL